MHSPPAVQASFEVHESPSSQDVPSWTRAQEPSVTLHNLQSPHFSAPGTHAPFWHLSPSVQASPSEQEEPSDLREHVPSTGLHSWHSPHFGPPGTHAPFWHSSPTVRARGAVRLTEALAVYRITFLVVVHASSAHALLTFTAWAGYQRICHSRRHRQRYTSLRSCIRPRQCKHCRQSKSNRSASGRRSRPSDHTPRTSRKSGYQCLACMFREGIGRPLCTNRHQSTSHHHRSRRLRSCTSDIHRTGYRRIHLPQYKHHPTCTSLCRRKAQGVPAGTW